MHLLCDTAIKYVLYISKALSYCIMFIRILLPNGLKTKKQKKKKKKHNLEILLQKIF